MISGQEGSLRSIGKYQILGPLGRGSMGLVYKARDPEIGRVVAIKTLRKILSADPQDVEAAVRRFKFEARSAGNLRHPNIITIFEVNHDAETPFIVMDYVEGESLDSIIEKERRVAPATMVQYLNQVAAGLDYAHSRGVVHRDIKPSNILVDRSGNVFILDFGIASINESFPGAEQTGSMAPIMGTPGYMSPEQILNEKLDHRTDLFSLAVVAFECLTGQRPFPGDNFTTVIGNILNSKPLSLTALIPEMPLPLEAEFEKALAKSREDRFESASRMLAAFAHAAGVDAGDGRGSPRAPMRTRKMSAWKSIKRVWGDETQTGPSKTSPVAEAASAPKSGQSAPWEAVKQAPVADSFSERMRMGTGSHPGAIFSHGDHAVGSQPFLRFKQSPARIVALSVAFACLVVASVVLWYALEPEAAPVVARQGSSNQNGANPALDAQTAGAQIGELVVPGVDPLPKDKTVHEMNDRELLGVIVRGGVSEEMIIDALRECRQRNVPALVDASVFPLQHDSFLVRLETIRILGEMGDKRIVPQLMLSLDDHDPLVRKEVAVTLGKLGDRRALGYLNARLFKEEMADVKAEIKNAIERINGFPMGR
ncbi:MAG: protein kinase [Oligoflexia bacterium]|nr:protein kinase [Oligoflexia bacterium]